MSIIARGSSDGKSNNSMVEAEVEVSSSSRGTSNIHDNNTTNLISHYNPSKLEESDEDLLTVPDVEARPAMDSTNNNSNNNTDQNQNQKRRRGRNPVDKEYRRLKRLLRNRVSAQQARERKKVYVNDLESRAKELQDLNSKLEERISTMINENTMLRKVLLNTRPKVDDTTGTERKQDQLAKS